jgi:hypothetical protein
MWLFSETFSPSCLAISSQSQRYETLYSHKQTKPPNIIVCLSCVLFWSFSLFHELLLHCLLSHVEPMDLEIDTAKFCLYLYIHISNWLLGIFVWMPCRHLKLRMSTTYLSFHRLQSLLFLLHSLSAGVVLHLGTWARNLGIILNSFPFKFIMFP